MKFKVLGVDRRMFNQKTSYGLAILSGILLLLSFPPFRFGAYLAWIALVPLLIAIYYQSHAKNVARLARVASFGFLPVAIWTIPWFQEFLSMLPIPNPPWLGFVVGIGPTIMAAMVFPELIAQPWKPKRLSPKYLKYFLEYYSGLAVFVLPVMLTTVEFLFMSLPGVMRIGAIIGLFSLAKTQWLNAPILHLASYTGVYGVTFLILLVNCGLAYAVVRYRDTKRVSKQALAVLPVFVIILALSLISVPERSEGDVNVVIIQTSLSGNEDYSATYLALTEESLKYEPRIVFWPFSAPGKLNVEPFVDFSMEHNVFLVDGARLVYPDGSVEYHNLGYHVVFLPEQIRSGDIYHVFFPEIRGFDSDLGKFGVVICFESCPTVPARDLARQDVEFLIVATGGPNDYLFSWVLGSNAVYRAAEHRMYAASIVGDRMSSMLIDPYGRIIEDIAPEEEIIASKISFTDERTFYTKYGDFFGWTVVGLALVFIGYDSRLKGRSPFMFCEECRVKINKDAEICSTCGKRQRKLSFWKRTLLHDYYRYIKKD